MSYFKNYTALIKNIFHFNWHLMELISKPVTNYTGRWLYPYMIWRKTFTFCQYFKLNHNNIRCTLYFSDKKRGENDWSRGHNYCHHLIKVWFTRELMDKMGKFCLVMCHQETTPKKLFLIMSFCKLYIYVQGV